jgi:dTDP-4-dehydrorhamnose 3,5-epimerase
MRFVETPIAGAWLVELDPAADDRGFFARIWCEREFAESGLAAVVSQVSMSYNRRRGTLRGLHYQARPHHEEKLIRCVRGAVFDVIVDVRRDSATLGRWYSLELSIANRRGLYVPGGVAHGFQTIEEDTELLYLISSPYHRESARALRWNDPTVGIPWPIPGPVLSSSDARAPHWEEIELQ